MAKTGSVSSFSSSVSDTLSYNNYIFSSSTNLESFRVVAKDYSKRKFQDIVSLVANKWEDKIIEIEQMETLKAREIAHALGLSRERKPTDAVLDWFNKLIFESLETENDQLTIETLLVNVYGKELKDILENAEVSKRKNFMQNALERFDILQSHDETEVSNFIRKFEEIINSADQNKIKGLNGIQKDVLNKIKTKTNMSPTKLVNLLQMEKGYGQEGFLLHLLASAKAITSVTSDVGTKFVGDLNKKVEQTIVDGIEKKGYRLHGGETGIHTDIVATFKGNIKVGISAKTTVDATSQSVLYRVSHKIGEPVSFAKARTVERGELHSLIDKAGVLIMSYYMQHGSFYGTDSVLRPLAYLILNSDEFINIIANSQQMEDETFHYLLNINNRFYWFSDFIKSIIGGIEDYAGKTYSGSFWKVGGLTKPGFSNSDLWKRKIQIKRKEVDRGKESYVERIPAMLADTELASYYREGKRIFDSSTLRMDGTMFRIIRESSSSIKRSTRKK